MSKREAFIGTALAALMLAALPALAQRPPRIPVQQDLASRSFRIRVVNKLNIPIYYKLVGGRGKSYVHQTLRPGDSEPDTVTGGEKVLCVWNLDDEVITVGVVLVDRSGRIVIEGWEEAEPAAGAKSAAKPCIPRLQIAPE